MNDEEARQGLSDADHPPLQFIGGLGEPWWTEADQAELDVLVFELSHGYLDEHRQRCRACSPTPCPELVAWRAHLEECRACAGDAPLTFGTPCERKTVFIAHGDGCLRCNPCPHLRKAIEVVIDWREARELRSRAEWLRAERVKLDESP